MATLLKVSEATAKVAEIEANYRFSDALLDSGKIKEDAGKIMVEVEGQWIPMNGMTRSVCESMDLSFTEMMKFPVDAQVYGLKSRVRQPLPVNAVFYKGQLVAIRNADRKMAQLSKILKIMESWAGWEISEVTHDSMESSIHVRGLFPDGNVDYAADDSWWPGVDLYTDMIRGRKQEIKALWLRLVCTNGLVRVHREASLEGRYKVEDDASLKKAMDAALARLKTVWAKAMGEIKQVGNRPVEQVKVRAPRLARMCGVKSKDVADSFIGQVQDKMLLYDLMNAFTFSSQKSQLVSERRTIQARASRMVQEVAGVDGMPFHAALFGDVSKAIVSEPAKA